MPWFNLPGGGTVHVCDRGRKPKRKRCASCNQLGDLECDGCDKPLCRDCAVSPKKNVDFCPTCARPVFEEWIALKIPFGKPGVDHATWRAYRRAAFRKWALENPERFDRLMKTKLQSAGDAGPDPFFAEPPRKATPNGMRELWLEAGGGTPSYDEKRYRELLIEAGHLVKRTETPLDAAARDFAAHSAACATCAGPALQEAFEYEDLCEVGAQLWRAVVDQIPSAREAP